jgi:hypothetical protein
MATVIARNDRVVVGARRDGLGRRRGRIQTSGTRMAQVDDKIVARQIHATTDRLDRMALPGGNRAVRAGLTIIRTDADRSTAIGAAAGPMTQVRGGGTKVVTSALVVERNGRPIVVEMDLWAIHDGAGHDTQISASTVRVSEAVMR